MSLLAEYFRRYLEQIGSVAFYHVRGVILHVGG